MISRKKELLIRKLLGEGGSLNAIARRVGANWWTVREVKRRMRLCESLDESTRGIIRDLIIQSLPTGAIEIRTGVPRETINAVKREYSLRRRNQGWRKAEECPTCGSMILPCCNREPEELPLAPRSIAQDDAKALFGISRELAELGDLQIIANPSFYNLSQRAKTLVKGLTNGEETKVPK